MFQSTPFLFKRANVTAVSIQVLSLVSIHALLIQKGELPAILVLWILNLEVVFRERNILGRVVAGTVLLSPAKLLGRK